ncbi:MAG TPA: DUF3108 domain-containing protein [Cytophagales bacterium]|nr:DUF3108 domain-containing protein [Cytophagales bacterium]
MIRSILVGWAVCLCCSCGKKGANSEKFIPSAPVLTTELNHYKKAETINYTAKLGLLKAADIVLNIDKELSMVDTTKCYKVGLMGSLDGTVDLFSELNDTFYSYVDTHSLKPRLFIKDQQENKYTRLEYTYFDFTKKQAKTVLKHTDSPDSIKYHPISEHVNDMLTSYFHLRKIDFDKYQEGDTLKIDVFLDYDSHNFKFILKKREQIHTKIGARKSILLMPIVPENELFRGDNPVSIWISDDENRIPLRLKAKSWVGNVEVDIKEYVNKR